MSVREEGREEGREERREERGAFVCSRIPALGRKVCFRQQQEEAGGTARYSHPKSDLVSLHPKGSVDTSRDSPCGNQVWEEKGMVGTLWAISAAV